jgi:hypothetical protein
VVTVFAQIPLCHTGSGTFLEKLEMMLQHFFPLKDFVSMLGTGGAGAEIFYQVEPHKKGRPDPRH